MHIFFLLHVYWFVNSCSNWFNLNTLYCSFKTIGLGTIQKDMYCIIALALPNSISENLLFTETLHVPESNAMINVQVQIQTYLYYKAYYKEYRKFKNTDLMPAP